MKILAVDDDQVFLDLLVPMLHASGEVDVTTALSAGEALGHIAYAAQAYDCILMDIQMPGMNGVQLCRAIRDLALYKRTPIVMITAMSTKGFIDDAFTAGATDYVTKPLDRQDLRARLGMVQRLLNERRSAAALAHQIYDRTNVVTVDVDFETPFLVPDFGRGMEYLALENYLLTLGTKRLHSMTAIGFHVENASQIMRKGNPAQFVAMLSDVASVIEDAIKTEQMMISYAGCGDFVGVVGALAAWDTEEMEAQINAGLAEFEGIYIAERLPLPRVKVGPRVRNSFFTSFKSTAILKRAIDHARGGRDRQPKDRWNAA